MFFDVSFVWIAPHKPLMGRRVFWCSHFNFPVLLMWSQLIIPAWYVSCLCYYIGSCCLLFCSYSLILSKSTFSHNWTFFCQRDVGIFFGFWRKVTLLGSTLELLPCVSRIVAFIVKSIVMIILFACLVGWLDSLPVETKKK